jgi:hypothetical protein
LLGRARLYQARIAWGIQGGCKTAAGCRPPAGSRMVGDGHWRTLVMFQEVHGYPMKYGPTPTPTPPSARSPSHLGPSSPPHPHSTFHAPRSTPPSPSQTYASSIHRRMERGGYGLPKVFTRPAMPYPSTPCRRATPETAHRAVGLRLSSFLLDTPRHTPLLSVVCTGAEEMSTNV